MITVGEVLKNKRQNLKITIDIASSDTKIQKRYLEYIENNEFSPFESDVFLTGFIKIYAEYLDLDVNKILALYRRTNPVKKEDEKVAYKRNSSQKGKLSIFTPQSVMITLLIVFAIGIITYIAMQIYKFQTPPNLTIEQPSQDITVEENSVSVKGKTDTNVVVEINDIVISTDEFGNFEKKVDLNEGINLITIKAKKNTNNVLETVETRKVTYIKQVENIKEEETVVQENKIILKVIDTSAWIKLDIDNENKLSQVIEPTELEYIVENTFHIISGRSSSTEVYYNGEQLKWTTTSTGVSEMTCNITEGSIVCE